MHSARLTLPRRTLSGLRMKDGAVRRVYAVCIQSNNTCLNGPGDIEVLPVKGKSSDIIVNRIRDMVMASRVTIASWAFRLSAPKKNVKEIVLSPPPINTNHSKGSIPVFESINLCLLNP